MHDLPGYTIDHYVDGFADTPIGPVPRVATSLVLLDHLGTIRARTGIARNMYKINPGLYCVGEPTPDSPVLVTANYKLSMDTLRKELTGINAYILVADTRGINVWCAAGKGTFSASEIALQVKRSRLAEIVSHRELILPQFGAVGVASHKLKKLCGFKGVYGPLRAKDIPTFLRNGKKADESMRTVTFTTAERLVLVPVEIALIWKVFLLVTMGIFAISGFGPDIYSLRASWSRGLIATGATIFAIVSGALVTPLLLPWIPGRQFWFKGVLIGLPAALAYIFSISFPGILVSISLTLWIVAVASYIAMNFTGATPFTSLSGVEKEMRNGLALQCTGIFLALTLWVIGPFVS